MGVTLKTPHCEHSLGYFSFFRFRCYIASLLGVEREYRATWAAMPFEDEYTDAEKQKAEQILGFKDKYVVDFLIQSDTEGHISKVGCERLKKLLLKDQHRNEACGTLGYKAIDPFCVDDFITMLRDGIRTGKGLEWY